MLAQTNIIWHLCSQSDPKAHKGAHASVSCIPHAERYA